MAQRVVRFVILGPPGSGKGTIASRIVKSFSLAHLATGNLIREQIAQQTELGKEADILVKRGQLLSDAVVSQLVSAELDKLTKKSWLLDGFPRTVAQAEFLQEHHPVDGVINLDVPFDEIIHRLTQRWIHLPSGRIYNLEWSPPKIQGKDDVTGEPLSQRPDDQPDAVGARLESYKEWEGPVAQYFKSNGLLTSFAGRATNEIWPVLQEWMDKRIQQLTCQ